MKISVVIPAYNEEKLLPTTLASIRLANAAWIERQWSVETIVCNNNSTDKTATVAAHAGAKVVFEPINQISRARNSGAAQATGDWIVFVDADSQPTKELFAAAADAIAKGTVLAGGSTLKLEATGWDVYWMIRAWNLISRINGWMAGAFIFVDATAFRKIGGFSHELFVGEELDLAKRLRPLAREQRKKMVILKSAPLLTSARKTALYSRKELLEFFLRFALSRKATETNPKACNVWYDGRR